jgi:hypothetical protein
MKVPLHVIVARKITVGVIPNPQTVGVVSLVPLELLAKVDYINPLLLLDIG